MSCCISMVSKAGDTIKYCSPLDFPLLLSANFGELRPNHFHNGLDFKTKGTVGHPVRCIADGYVSRVAVQHGGYGQAIYITHPDGHTSFRLLPLSRTGTFHIQEGRHHSIKW